MTKYLTNIFANYRTFLYCANGDKIEPFDSVLFNLKWSNSPFSNLGFKVLIDLLIAFMEWEGLDNLFVAVI